MLKHFYCVPKCFCRLDKSMGAVILNLINCLMFTRVCSEYAIIRLFTCSEYVIIRLFTCSDYAIIRLLRSEYAIIRWNTVFLFCADFFLYNNESETEFFSSFQWLVQTRYSCFDVFPFSVSETVFFFSFLVVTRAQVVTLFVELVFRSFMCMLLSSDHKVLELIPARVEIQLMTDGSLWHGIFHYQPTQFDLNNVERGIKLQIIIFTCRFFKVKLTEFPLMVDVPKWL